MVRCQLAMGTKELLEHRERCRGPLEEPGGGEDGEAVTPTLQAREGMLLRSSYDKQTRLPATPG